MSTDRHPSRDEPAASRAATSQHKRLDIQGLRGVAVILVVGFHTGLILDGGFVGVDVFFVISGYVITAMLLRELDTTGRIRLRTFYARRIARLLPALGLVTTVVAVASALLLSPLGQQQQTAKLGLGATFYTANVVEALSFDYFHAAANPLVHMWSLSVEEQFYLGFPLLLLLGWMLARKVGKRGRRGSMVAVGIVSIASFAISWALSYALVPQLSEFLSRTFAYFLAPGRAWEFAVGAAVAFGVPVIRRFQRLFSDTTAWIALVVIVSSALAIDGSQPFPGLVALLPVLATAVVIAAGWGSATRVPALLAMRPLVWIGDISYAWYLWHFPAIFFAKFAWPGRLIPQLLAAGLSLAPAWASYQFVENPIRHNPSTTWRRTLTIVGASTLTPVLALSILLIGSRNQWGNPGLQQTAAQILPFHADVVSGCTGKEPLGSRPSGSCEWNGEASGPAIYLIGDSNAGQFSEAAIQAATAVGSPLQIATSPGCPFVDAVFSTFGIDADDCRRFVAETIEWLQDQPPGVVVLASASDIYLNDPDTAIRLSEKTTTAATPTEKAEIWFEALRRTLDALGPHQVVVIHPTPKFTGGSSRVCPLLSALGDPSCYGHTIPRQKAEQYRDQAVAAENRAAEEVRARMLDVFDELCPNPECRSNDASAWFFRDPIHISVPANDALVPSFVEVISAALADVTVNH